jgi:hypothetical protein
VSATMADLDGLPPAPADDIADLIGGMASLKLL